LTIYADTSVLVAYYCPEPPSETAERHLRALDPPVLSRLTDVELHSALAKKVRREELTEENAQRIEQLFRRHCEQELYHIVPVQEGEYRQAREWMARRSTAVRTLDALHLAAADCLDVHVLTADTVMNRAGEQLEVPVQLLEVE
jgi:predicted nucleic acid-binding protein